jgi:membrane-associated phospholipid phosphatase
MGVVCLVWAIAGGEARAAPEDDLAAEVEEASAASPTAEVVLRWNRIAVDASGLDHTPVAPGESRVFGEQLGPGRSSRALAIVHIAVFEVVNAISGGHRSYLGLPRAPAGTSARAAIAQAARDTLAAMFPSQAPAFDALLREELRAVGATAARARGIVLGRLAATLILLRRVNDGSEIADPHVGVDYTESQDPGHWRHDPISQLTVVLGKNWDRVKPFAMARADQFRAPPPPAMTSQEYAAAFDEVKALGGDGVVTPTVRSAEQTEIGIYWAYDGRPSLCAPPRLYNQIAVRIAEDRGTVASAVRLARLLALINVAMADAGIAVWDSKYHYNLWRPITGIREADEGTGPSGLGDGNPDTEGDLGFSPLGAPASNGAGPNFTPPFPAYPSGHAGFGGALFQVLRRFYGTDAIRFDFVSDELNGETTDNTGQPRPRVSRHFESLSEAEEENGQSRIYLGIHWSFDKTAGIAMGNQVGDRVFDRLFRPL